MDKYEYRLKAEQIEKLVKKKDYKTAVKIADTIDWRRVKNLNMLYLVAEIYEKMERYEDCMEILNIAYDRAPVGRMLLYRMTDIATKMKNFPEAISLYREFVKLAPHDPSRYILKYQIYRERGSDVEDQIRILEDYKTHEYQEKWAYELARCYAEAGRIEECIQECDELILWFSEGEYVIRAMELKMQYEPLNAAQQKKYDQSRTPLHDPEKEDFQHAEVPEFNTDKFSTMNLQAELAANLGELLEAEEEIQIPSLELPEEKDEAERKPLIEVVKKEEPVLEELELPPEPEEEEPAFEELELPPEEEEPVFEELELPPEPEEEEPVFEELELPPEEEELVFEELELPLEEEEPVFEELKLPETTPELKELPEEEMRQVLEGLLEELPALDVDSVPEELSPEEDSEKKENQQSIAAVLADWETKRAETEAVLNAGKEQEKERKEKVKQETAELIKLIEGVSEEIPTDIRQIMAEIDEERQKPEELVTEDDLPPDLDLSEEAQDISFEDLEIQEPAPAVRKKQNLGETASLNMIQELERALSAEVSEMAVNAGHLTREQARLFAYFTSVKGMSQQLSVLFKGASRSGLSNSSRGNLVITGKRGNGKTTLAIDIVKALQRQDQISGKRLAKISGQKLNTKDIQEVLGKLKGGALIVENAGALSDQTMMALSLAMEGDTGGLLMILEDSSEEIHRIFHRNKNFAQKFDHTIDIPVFTNDELVAFGKSYALEQGYVFDEFGVLALYDKIGSQQTRTHLVSVAEVKELIDGAIAHAEKRSFRHLFEKVTKRSQDEFGNHLLREEDFL